MRAALTTLLFLIAPAQAATISGKVINVADGDTTTVLDVDRTQHRIRIGGIDAPERKQPFGDTARQSMARMVSGKEVVADCHKVDRYGRQVCKVFAQPTDCPTCGMTLDVGHAQILAGMAWWYREYAKEQPAEDRVRYEAAEQDAQARKLGLWRDANPVAPWEWRRRAK